MSNLWTPIFLILLAYLLKTLNSGENLSHPLPNPSHIDTCSKNTKLQDHSYHLHKGLFHGPETVVFRSDGVMVSFTSTGHVVGVHSNGTTEDICFTGGRPLSGVYDEKGNLIIADVVHGLMELEKSSKKLVILSNKVDVPSKKELSTVDALRYVDDVEISKDGKLIYFSDACQTFSSLEHETIQNGRQETKFNPEKGSTECALRGRKDGRLLVYDREKRETKMLVDGLFFANGVALSRDEDFVLVSETFQSRITRHWLKGENKGKTDVLIDNLCGYPDGISRSTSDESTFWIAMISPPNDLVTLALPSAILRNLISLIPESLKPAPLKYGLVLRVNSDGKILETFHDPTGSVVSGVTSVTERDGKLYLGNLRHEYLSVFDLKGR